MRLALIACTVLALAALPTFGQDPAGMFLSDAAEWADGALAQFRYRVRSEALESEPVVSGLAVCIEPSGVFMTTDIDPRLPVNMLEDFEIVMPGVDGETIPAELMGIDPASGLGFVRTTGERTFKAIRFRSSAGLEVGQPVGSAGLLTVDPALPKYMGLAYVSSTARLPVRHVYVTGGKLTGIGSPVFDTEGYAIGLVKDQLYVSYQTPSQQGGSARLPLQGRQETSFFTPVEEFIHVLENVPTGGAVRRPPWLGVGNFEQVTEETAKLYNISGPAIMVDKVVEGHPADRAGLRGRDIILAVDGEPVERLGSPSLTAQNFVRRIERMQVGETIELTIRRGQETRTVEVELAATPKLPAEAERYVSRELGFIVREKVMLDRYLGDSPTAEVPGLVVLQVGERTVAARDGLQNGDLITQVNSTDVTTVSRLREVLDGAMRTSPGEPISFIVRRGNQAQRIEVRPPTR